MRKFVITSRRPVTKSVTPRGVEHCAGGRPLDIVVSVTKSVTPRGVEHEETMRRGEDQLE